jgi:hypothetical protein
MAYKTKKTGMQQVIINLLNETDPKALWQTDELANELGVKIKAAENAVYNAWTLGRICRHKEKSSEGKVRYAAKISDKDNLLFENRPVSGAGTSNKQKKRKNIYATSKEVRMAFAEVQRSLMRLEDAVMDKIADAEEMDKNLTKLRNLL